MNRLLVFILSFLPICVAPQSTVIVEMYDKTGKKTEIKREAVRAEWYVVKGSKRKVIQTLK